MHEARSCPRCAKAMPEETPPGMCADCLESSSPRGVLEVRPDRDHVSPPEDATEQFDEPADDVGIHVVAGTAAAIGRAATEGPGSQIGPYRLLQKLGEGGMGVVYLAEQVTLDRRRVA